MLTPILFMLLFTLQLVMYQRAQFADKAGLKGGNARWHGWGWIMRVTVFAFILWFQWPHWKPVVLAGALSLPVFDIGINLLALFQGAFYIGSTDWWDKKIGHAKWAIYLILIILAIAVNVVPWNAES